jgi:Uma2 family endonuclease
LGHSGRRIAEAVERAYVGFLLRCYSDPGNGDFGEHEVLTDKGVKITDVLWVNAEHPWDKHSTKPIIPAPDVCVEVRSPNNSIDSLEKRDAYLRAGAKEVWICDPDRFFDSTGQIPASKLCPWCPDNYKRQA